MEENKINGTYIHTRIIETHTKFIPQWYNGKKWVVFRSDFLWYFSVPILFGKGTSEFHVMDAENKCKAFLDNLHNNTDYVHNNFPKVKIINYPER
jgi:hypothetical protein